MNWDQIKGDWKQFTGKVKEKWGKFTDDDLTMIDGHREQMVGILQERYGYAKERAESELNNFTDSKKLVKPPRECPRAKRFGDECRCV